MKRRKMPRKKDRKVFTKTAVKTRKENVKLPMRGGKRI